MSTGTISPAATIEQDGKYLKLKLWFCRALYANVHEPRPGKDGKPPQFDCEFLLPKTASGANEIAKAIFDAGKEAFKGAKCHYAVIHNPDREIEELRNMGQEVPEALAMKAGHYVIRANSSVDKRPNTRGVIYSGCYAHAVIGVTTYVAPDNSSKGVKGYLNGVAFAADGERLGGSRVDLDAEFGPPPAQSQSQGDDFGAGAYTGSQNDPNSDTLF